MLELYYVSHRMSLDLVETLLNIAETGNFDEVFQLFGAPLKQCPEILFFGLLQAKVGYSGVYNFIVLYYYIIMVLQAKVGYSEVYIYTLL